MNDGPAAENLSTAVSICLSKPQAINELLELYDQVDRDVAAKKLKCQGCGKCCDFQTAGHRLFASTLELAALTTVRPDSPPPEKPLICQYQKGPACTARKFRPLGCRLYFCDPAAADWFCKTYESYHAKIKILHSKHGIPYTYSEITNSLPKIIKY